jgi:NAD(P)-dependent dehydrogenase (short-subunit alcohol dehydrogenase family)
METKNKIALVTGGSRGLGKDMALRLAEKGLDVILTYNSRVEDARQVLAQIGAAGGGIVNISSGLTRFSVPGSSAYASMKSAVETFTRYLAKELGPRGIRANVVAPGAILTDFGDGHLRNNAELQKIVSNITAFGRPGVAEDIGGVVAFLCTDRR